MRYGRGSRLQRGEVFAAVRGRRLSPVEPLIGDLEHQTAPLPRAAGADERTKRTRDPPLASDHLADVLLGHMEPEDDRVVALLLLDADCVRVVDQPPREVDEELRQAASP